MRFGKYLFLGVISIFALQSCSNDDERGVVTDSVAVQFTSSLKGTVESRASNDQWDANDAIGIFMITNGQDLSATNIVDSTNNISYVTKNNGGTFLPKYDSEKIFYPDSKSVDFIAYYPYRDSIADFTYKVDITDQSNQEEIDLLYSDNSKGMNKNTPISALEFSHELVKLTFNITKGNGISSLTGLQIAITGTNTLADFDLGKGTLTVDQNSKAVIQALVESTSTTGKGEAIVLPSTAIAGRTLKFSLGSGESFTYNISNTKVFEKGKKYNFNITLQKSGAIINPISGYIELPESSSIPDTEMITHMFSTRANQRNYSMLYDKKYRLAYWVAYPLVQSHITGAVSQTGQWAYDPLILPQSAQPDLKKGWPGHNGKVDRGHQIASSDRNANATENGTTFYYSNMTVQDHDLNGQMWADLEKHVQSFATNNVDTVYVVTGAMIQTKTDKTINYRSCNAGRQVAVPKYYFKAIAQKKNGVFKTIAYSVPNVTPPVRNYNLYSCTVKELEEETGFTFFPSLDESVKNLKGL